MQPIRDAWTTLRRWFQRSGPEPPDDPYAYVGAPRKPRSPVRSASVAERPEP